MAAVPLWTVACLPVRQAEIAKSGYCICNYEYSLALTNLQGGGGVLVVGRWRLRDMITAILEFNHSITVRAALPSFLLGQGFQLFCCLILRTLSLMLLILACNASLRSTIRAFHRRSSRSRGEELPKLSIGTVYAVLGFIFGALGGELLLDFGKLGRL
jgi:hypothetical protein